jgi:hypothetical protein
MKIKCFRFECSHCGEVTSIQVFYRKDGSVGYDRARHKNAQGFFYRPIPKEYAIEKLGVMTILNQGQLSSNKIIDPNNSELSPKLRKVAGGDSYEPSFEPSGRNGVEDRTPNFWMKGAKQSILHKKLPLLSL